MIKQTTKKVLTNVKDNIYRLKSMSINEIMEKYPDKVVELRMENGRAVLQLDRLRIKYD